MFIHNMKYNLLGYFVKFTVPVSQVHFAHFAKSRTQIDLIFYQIAKSTLFQFKSGCWQIPPWGWFILDDSVISQGH